MPHKQTIIWREWYNKSAVEKLTALGTLPRHETEIADTRLFDGEDIAREVAMQANKEDPEWFREGGDIVIIEPEEWAGKYEVHVDYEPRFYAYQNTDGE